MTRLLPQLHLTAGPLLLPVAALLAVASGLELALLRTFSRTALHIPDLEPIQLLYTWSSEAGRYAYFVAVAALAASLVTALLFAARSVAIAAPLLVAFAAYMGATLLTPGESVSTVVPISLSVAAITLAATLVVGGDLRRVFLVAPIVVAFAASAGWHLGQSLNVGSPGELTWLAEAMTLVAAAALPFALRARFHLFSLISGLLVFALAMAYFARDPATAGIFLLWNAGLVGSLPGVVYAAAAGLAAASLVAFLVARDWQSAIVLTLLVCGGLTLQNTYQTGLLFTALVLLAVIPRPERAPHHALPAQRSAARGFAEPAGFA